MCYWKPIVTLKIVSNATLAHPIYLNEPSKTQTDMCVKSMPAKQQEPSGGSHYSLIYVLLTILAIHGANTVTVHHSTNLTVKPKVYAFT